MRKLVAIAGFVALSCAAIGAAEFWDEKAFTMWSDQEVRKILSDSPWSHEAQVTFVAPAAGAPAGGRPGGGGRAGAGRGGARGGQQMPFTITWRSALPMKQALVRSQVGLNGAVTSASQQMLDQTENEYAVSVTGLPMAFVNAFDGAKEATFLLREGKAPVPAAEILSAPQPDGTLLMLAVFPRSMPLTVEDREVEFVTRLGTAEIKRTFDLRQMVFMGRLEL